MRGATKTRTDEVRRFVAERMNDADDDHVARAIASDAALETLGYVVTREDLVAIYLMVRPEATRSTSGLAGVIDYLAGCGIPPAGIIRWLDGPEGIEMIGRRTSGADLVALLRPAA